MENNPRRYQILAVQQTDNPESIVTRQLHKMTRVGNMAGTKAHGEAGQEAEEEVIHAIMRSKV